MIPVPCPSCGGLVGKSPVKCSRCGACWESVLELLFDGLCATSERMAKIAEAGDWSHPVQVMQDIIDLFSLNKKYHLEIERMERK